MKKIRVGFDISQLAHRGGVATYTENLSAQLSRKDSLEMNFFYSSLRKPYLGELPNVYRSLIPPTILEILLNQWRLIPIELFLGEIEIFHSSDWIQPKTRAKKVTTYHDLIPIKFPQWSDKKIIQVHHRRLKIVENEVDMVVAVSESTKQDLIQVSSIPENKIKVIYEGVDDIFKPQSQADITKFKDLMKLPDKFVLAIGGIGPRRNLDRAGLACHQVDLPMIITGKDIIYLSKDQMPLLYASASMLLYPSLYEGFGLPILEAMASHTPVITSNVSSMPEIGGDAALYIDPTNIEMMAKKIVELCKDNSLRNDLVRKGITRTKQFSWEKCANETEKVYQEMMRE